MNRIEPTFGQLPASQALTPYKDNGGRKLMMNSQHQGMLAGLEKVSVKASSEAYHALTVLKGVEGLKANPNPVNSYCKNGDPTRRCVVFSGFEVEYELNHLGGSQTDIEIVDIRLTDSQVTKRERAGLWEASYDDDGWAATQWLPKLSKGKTASGAADNPIKVGINGYCLGLNHAAGMLPDHIARGDAKALATLQQSGYQLLYVPQKGNGFKEGWTTLTNMGRVFSDHNQVEAAQILAAHMIEAHQQGLSVEWTSHRGGSFVLTEAMKLLRKQVHNLEQRQKIFLSDHSTSHALADQERRALNMDVSDAKWQNSNSGIAQKLGGQLLGASALACSITEIRHTPRAQRPGKVVELAFAGAKTVKTSWATGGVLAGLTMQFGLTTAFASALVKAVGSMAVQSVPSLNEKYSKGEAQVYGNMANKAFGGK